MSEKDLKEANSEMDSKSFDDAELEDIMNEIEELEKDFATDDSADDISEALGIADSEEIAAEDLSVAKESVQSTELQDVIDQEVEGILDDAIASTNIESEPVIAEEKYSDPQVIEEPISEPIMEEEPLMAEEVIHEPVMEEEVSPGLVMVKEVAPEPIIEEEPIAEQAEPGASDISARDEALEAIESKIVAFESSEEEEEMSDKGLTETRMDFAVSGQMKLSLNFEVSGQKVHLSVDEENGFLIEMDGGARFSVPMDVKKAS